MEMNDFLCDSKCESCEFKKVKILNYITRKYEIFRFPVTKISAENAVIEIAKKFGISPLAVNCFRLRKVVRKKVKSKYKKIFYKIKRKNKNKSGLWMKNDDILEDGCEYEFRLRFFVPIDRLKSIDNKAYYYYFKQICWDIIHEKISDLKYPNHKSEVLGLCASIIYVEGVETNKSIDYKKIVPTSILFNHFVFCKYKLNRALSKLEQSGLDYNEIINAFMIYFNELTPSYILEEYTVEVNHKDLATVKVNLKDEHKNGVVFLFNTNRKEWILQGKLNDIDSIHQKHNELIIYWENDYFNPTTITFLSISDKEQFLANICGYYQLSVNWMKNICSQFPSKNVDELKQCRCHGPIDDSTSRELLNEYKKSSYVYLLRQSQKYHNTFQIDICRDRIIKIGFKTIELSESGMWKADLLSEPTLEKLLDKLINSHSSLAVPPSKTAKCQDLLICSASNPQTESSIYGMMSLVDVKRYLKIFIDKTKATKINSSILFANWRDEKVKLRVCNIEQYQAEFIAISTEWNKLNSSTLLKGFCMSLESPCANILEWAEHGKLNKFLLKEKVSIKFLLKSAITLTRAVEYLDDNFLKVHPLIRCSNVFVTSYVPNDIDKFEIKLGDPGIPVYTSNDFPWIPKEFSKDITLAYESKKTLFWAFTTTLWEIFNRGRVIDLNEFREWSDEMLRDEGVILDVGCIPDEIAQILKNGWSSTSNSLDYDNIITTLRNLSNKEDDELETQSFDIFEDNLYYTEVSEEESLINTNYVKMRDLPTGQSIYSGWNPEKFECKLSNMTISVDGERLGEGNFGVVLRGNIIYSRNPRQNGIVAVKILKKHSDKENKVFCKEMALSETLDHKNIVKIITTVRVPDMIIMEYVPCTLKEYIMSDDLFSTRKVLKLALNIAEGMIYLKSKNIVHRDLAGRNILVSQDQSGAFFAKISDFGLAREVNDKEYYRNHEGEEHPLRWYSLETLETNKFTFESDVWSYGVLLYEMFSEFQLPYTDLRNFSQLRLIDYLKKGNRLEQPKHCDAVVYKCLMKPCWRIQNRPSFEQIQDIILQYL